MNDRFGRTISYLRLSLTERCTLKCTYCRAGEGACPKKSELTQEEFLRIVRAMVRLMSAAEAFPLAGMKLQRPVRSNSSP